MEGELYLIVYCETGSLIKTTGACMGCSVEKLLDLVFVFVCLYVSLC